MNDPARFHVSDVFSVYGDPFGHYRHLTILWGEWETGSFCLGTKFEVPLLEGSLVVRALGWDPARRGPANTGGMLITPSIPDAILRRGVISAVSGENEQELVHRALAGPMRIAFLHEMRVTDADLRHYGKRREDGPFPCWPCASSLGTSADVMVLVRSALTDPRAEVVAAARGILRV